MTSLDLCSLSSHHTQDWNFIRLFLYKILTYFSWEAIIVNGGIFRCKQIHPR